MFTEPQIVTSDDLNKRSYITFYFREVRKREYNGKALGLILNPNRAKTIEQRTELLRKLRYEFNKALDANLYPVVIQEEREDLTQNSIKEVSENTSVLENKVVPANIALLDALKRKLNSPLAKFYKRNLRTIHRQLTEFLTHEELNQPVNNISTLRFEEFLSQFGSSGTYYMNKRRDLGVLITVTAKLTGHQNIAVKETERRKAKAKLHKPYEKKQLKPILNYLKARYPNMYICCLLLYSTWLRPHEEIRLLTRGHFMNDMSEIHLSGDENKGGKVRVVYIPEYVREVIIPFISNLQRDDNIFSKSPQPFNDAYFNTQWTRAWHKMFPLGLVYKDQTPYSFRHTAAIAIYKKTKDVYLLQKLLGHSTIAVTLKYLRSLGEFNSEELREAAPQLD